MEEFEYKTMGELLKEDIAQNRRIFEEKKEKQKQQRRDSRYINDPHVRDTYGTRISRAIGRKYKTRRKKYIVDEPLRRKTTNKPTISQKARARGEVPPRKRSVAVAKYLKDTWTDRPTLSKELHNDWEERRYGNTRIKKDQSYEEENENEEMEKHDDRAIAEKNKNIAIKNANADLAHKTELSRLKSQIAANTSDIGTLETVNEWVQKLETIEPYECGVFTPLARPTSGLREALLCEFGEKRVLLLGEHHARPTTTPGFPPISEFIEEYARNVTEPVDFMVEQSDETQKQMYWGNIDIYQMNPDYTTLQGLHYRLFPFMKNRNNKLFRAHWVDLRPKKIIGEGYKKGPYPEWFINLTNYVLTVLAQNGISRVTVSDYITSTFVDPYLNMNGEEFSSYLLNMFEQLPELQQCMDRKLYRQFHIKQMIQRIHQEANEPKWAILFLYRLIMDIYTVCRLLKTHVNGWYKNIVVYAGAFHTRNVGMLLQQYGFTVRKVNIQLNESESN